MKVHALIGPVARQLCIVFDGVIIGSMAEKLFLGPEISAPGKNNHVCTGDDIDIVVPLDRWVQASKIIPHHARANAFGGFKFRDGALELDVWADDVARVLFMSPWKEKTRYLWSPKYGGALQWVSPG